MSWFGKNKETGSNVEKTVEPVVETVVEYVDVNFVDVDREKFARELRKLFFENRMIEPYESPIDMLAWFVEMLEFGLIGHLMEECTYIPPEYVGMKESIKRNSK
mgnify:CR=1 FL=1|jgi:hypothetical protein